MNKQTYNEIIQMLDDRITVLNWEISKNKKEMKNFVDKQTNLKRAKAGLDQLRWNIIKINRELPKDVKNEKL